MTLQQSTGQPAAEALAPSALSVRLNSGYGCLKATGEDTLDLLNRLSTNRVDHLQPGNWAPTVLTSDRGRIVDLLTVIHAGDFVYLLTSPGQQQPVIEWLDKYTIMEDLEVEDVSNSTTVVALAGDGAGAALGLESTGPEPLPGLQYPTATVNVGGHDAIALSRPMGATPCCLLVAPSGEAAGIVEALAATGAVEAGVEAWEALRVASGAPAFGPEMGEPYNPLETGLIGAIDFTKGCYIGQEVIARLDSYERVQRYLSVLRFSDSCEANASTPLYIDGRQAGTVTSVYRTPGGELRGLGFVRTASATPGQVLEVASPATGTATVEDTPKLFGPGQDFS